MRHAPGRRRNSSRFIKNHTLARDDPGAGAQVHQLEPGLSFWWVSVRPQNIFCQIRPATFDRLTTDRLILIKTFQNRTYEITLDSLMVCIQSGLS